MPPQKKPLDNPIKVEYISDDTICYVCEKCQDIFFFEFNEEEAQRDWFQFSCQQCDAKRKIALGAWKKPGKKETPLLITNEELINLREKEAEKS